ASPRPFPSHPSASCPSDRFRAVCLALSLRWFQPLRRSCLKTDAFWRAVWPCVTPCGTWIVLARQTFRRQGQFLSCQLEARQRSIRAGKLLVLERRKDQQPCLWSSENVQQQIDPGADVRDCFVER